MTATAATISERVRERARRAATRELRALAAHTPCVQRLEEIDGSRFVVHADLPYLALADDDGDRNTPRVCHGFRLAVQLGDDHPDDPPRVVFFGAHLVFHPAISPAFSTFCIGNGLWTPDVGLASYMILHLEAVIGMIDIDTMDALFLDPLCARAAVHYRQLREAGGLPLADPVFLTGHRGNQDEGATVKRCLPVPELRSAARIESEPRTGVRTYRMVRPNAQDNFTVKSRRGRRPVSIGGDDPRTATCVLTEPGWRDRLTDDGREALGWLAVRIAAGSDPSLIDIDGAAALRMTVPGGGEEGDPAAVAAAFESALRQWELAILSLVDPAVSRAVAIARRDHV